ncbi:acyl-CoA thioesterase [Blastococcus aggregatus]|uniref:acyl-CoA thioesterase n=1 Tax=Blastococcus aggregatus TaxID=38502 RepID=UPI0015965ED7|nr:thioesterase family protein [Blastococcus aggregatus]
MTLAITSRRLSMGDVDQVIAFYGRYFSWMDDGFSELLRVLGHPVSGILQDGYGLPVVETGCRYLRAVGLDESLRIETAVVATRRTSLDIGHVMWADDDQVAVAQTTHVWVRRTPELSPEPVPQWIRAAVTIPEGYQPPPSR